MRCQEFESGLYAAAAGASSPEVAAHLPTCESCRAALAREQTLLDRIDSELEESLEIQPSPAFLPAVRRRVAEVRAQRETARRWWLVPALATLAGVLVVGHLLRDATPTPTTAVPGPSGPAERPLGPVAEALEPETTRAPEAAPAPSPREVAVDKHRVVTLQPRQGDAETPSTPRVVVPPEDAEVVRRLARRLRGHAARTAVMGPDVEGPFDFALKPIEGQQEVVTMDRRGEWGKEPRFAEPLSFERTVEKAGRET
ncbi:MAG: hypothetical protein LJF30_08690 [Acidobacteria bacterium]|nr:hypothetical protein [Acidobacteriota bacterium]